MPHQPRTLAAFLLFNCLKETLADLFHFSMQKKKLSCNEIMSDSSTKKRRSNQKKQNCGWVKNHFVACTFQ